MSMSITMTKVLNNKFTVTIKDSTIPDVYVFDRFASGLDYNKNADATINLIFQNCIIPEIPDYMIKKFAYLQEIEIVDSIISGIYMKSLMRLKRIEKLSLINSTVEEHSGTIFENFKNMTFNFERQADGEKFVLLKVQGEANIDELQQDEATPEASAASGGIFTDPLTNRPVLKPRSTLIQPGSFSFNPTEVSKPNYTFGIDAFGSPQSAFGGVFSQPAVNTAPVKRVCGIKADTDQKLSKKSSENDHKTMLKDRNLKLQTMNTNMAKEMDLLREQVMKLEIDNKKLSENGILPDLKKIFNDEIFKDFRVTVNNEKSYKVHKILFAARSSIIADMIRNNPDAENLALQDISLPIFDIMLDFIYNDTPPEDDERLIEIFAAAGKLNIVELKNMTALRLLDKIDDKNSFKILELSNKYGNDELRLKAFEEIKKTLSDYKLRDEFSKNPDKIKKLLDMKRKMDEEYEKMQQEIEGIQSDIGEKRNESAGGSVGNSDEVEFEYERYDIEFE